MGEPSGSTGDVPASAPPTERVDSLGETVAAVPSTLEATLPIESSGALMRSAGLEIRPFGPFSKIEPLSEQGAMGVVARGYHAAFDRWELLKFLRPELSSDPEVVRQFFREGRVLAKLSHPNIVRVFAIYALDGRPCLAMEFLEGRSLKAYGEEHGGRAPIQEIHELFLAAARGLSAAHEVALLHRDIKPENLFVARDRPGAPGGLKLIDFGLATAYRSRHTGDFDPALVARTSGGTPLYMAPELWRGEMGSPKTDIYALGLSFFQLLTGRLPFEIEATVEEMSRAIRSNAPFLDARDIRPETPAPLALALGRAIRKDASERFATADDLVVALTAAASAARPRRVPGSGPYRGLQRYEAAERDVFFGRDAEIAEVLERLRGQPGVVLVGPSGSGKSSLARAGLLPAIEEGALGADTAYRPILLEPRTMPIRSLAAALAKTLGPSEAQVAAFLRERPEALGPSLRAALPLGTGVVLFVDQLEEIATVASDPAEARDFAAALGSLIDVGAAPLRLVATLRADRMDRLFAIEPLRPLLTRGFYPVRLLGGDALRRAVVEPAAAAGYRLEDPSLADAIVRDVSGSPGALPLLSFAMAAWWKHRDEAAHTLPTAAWKELGGLAGALAQHGDGVMAAMSDDERRAAEPMLVRLVSADRTRVPVPRATLIDPASTGPGAARALDRLLEANLVQESAGSIQLTHDALVTSWPRLAALLVSSGVDRAFHERVTAAARPWHDAGRPIGALWTGEQAQRLLQWFATTNAPLDQTDLAFIEAVRGQRSRAQRRFRLLALLAIALPIAFGLVAASNAREMKKRLSAAEDGLTKAKAAYATAETGRLRAMAARDVARDPAAALRSAAAGYELAHDPALDVLAWEARSHGVPVPLVSLDGKVALVDVAPRTRWIAAAVGGQVATFDGASSGRGVYDGKAVVSALAFSPDGQRLAIGGEDGTITIADVPSFEPRIVGFCGGAVRRLAWASPASLAAACHPSGGAWQLLQGMDPKSNSVPPSTQTLADDVSAVDPAVHDGRVLVGRTSGEVAWASADPKAPPTTAARHKERVVLVSRGPGDATFSIDAGLHAILHAGAVERTFEVGALSYAWIEARRAVAFVSAGGGVQVVSLQTGEVVGDVPSPRSALTSLGSDTPGEWVVAGTRSGLLLAVDLDQATTSLTQGPTSPPPACSLSDDGTAVGCAAANETFVRYVARSTGPARPDFPVRAQVDPPRSLLLGPSGTPVLQVGAQTLTLADATARPLGLASSVVAVSSKRFAIAGADPSGAPRIVVGALDGSRLDPRPWPSPITAVAFDATGARAFIASTDRRVRSLDESGLVQDVATLEALGPKDSVRSVAPDEAVRTLAVGTTEGEVWRVRLSTREEVKVTSLGAPIACLRAAREGRAVVASAGREAFVVDLEGGGSFAIGESAAPITACARSVFSDRFTFVDARGSVWLRALDLASVSVSYVPPDPADKAASPSIESWRGLPPDL